MRLCSLRWQIQLWHAALLFLLIAAVLSGFYHYERRAGVARIDAELTGPLIALLPRHIRLPNRGGPGGISSGPDSTPRNGYAVEQELEARGHYIVILNRDGSTLYASSQAPDSLPGLGPDVTGATLFGRWNGAHRELVNVTPGGHIAILARHSASIDAELRRFAFGLALIGLAVVGLGLLGGHFIARRATRPLLAIADAARRIADGGWNERIPDTPAPAEIDELRSVLNDSFDRIAAAYEEQRRFTADASHELGTPVAIILGKTQHALSRPRPPEDYVEALRVCQRAGERMKALNRSLLDLAAHDAGTGPHRLLECDLAELAHEALALVAAHASERGSALDADLPSLSARVDPLAIVQVLVNLLNNALAHNQPGVRVRITLREEMDRARFEVADNGAGIPATALPHLFDRFFRADSARTHDRRGAGLGLSIAHRIVELHGGILSGANRPEGGALFTVTLPRNPVAAARA